MYMYTMMTSLPPFKLEVGVTESVGLLLAAGDPWDPRVPVEEKE